MAEDILKIKLLRIMGHYLEAARLAAKLFRREDVRHLRRIEIARVIETAIGRGDIWAAQDILAEFRQNLSPRMVLEIESYTVIDGEGTSVSDDAATLFFKKRQRIS